MIEGGEVAGVGVVLQADAGTVGRWLFTFLVLGGFTAFALYLGGKYLRQWLALRGYERVSVDEATATDGPVALEGTATTEDPVEPVLADEDSVGFRSYLKSITPARLGFEWNPRNPIESPLEDGTDFSTPWRTVEKGKETTAFWLEDDAGRIRVEPDDATLYVTGEKRHAEVDPARDVGPQLADVDDDEIVRDKREIYDGKGEIMTFVWSIVNWRDRWYREGHIADGDQVFVAGPVETDRSVAAEAGTVDAVVRSDGSGDPFIVTNRSRPQHARKLLSLGGLTLAGGAVFLGLLGWGVLQTI